MVVMATSTVAVGLTKHVNNTCTYSVQSHVSNVAWGGLYYICSVSKTVFCGTREWFLFFKIKSFVVEGKCLGGVVREIG